jgi:hypothetical protein
MARYIGPKTKIARKFRNPFMAPIDILKRKIIPQDSMDKAITGANKCE